MTKSVTKIQDKDTQKRLSVVRSTADPTKYGIVVLNPDGSRLAGPKGDPGDAATITVGSTTTGNPGTNANVVNIGTTSAAVLDFTIPRGDKGNTGATGNGIASVTSEKVGKVTTVTITETNGDDYSFTVSDGVDGEGAGDVLGPNSSTDGDVVLFDGNTGKLIKDGGSRRIYIITESMMTKTTTQTKGVAPYNTSYYYTNFEIDESSGVKWVEGAIYMFMWNSFTASSSYRNVRIRIGATGDWMPLMSNAGVILAGSTYVAKSYVRPYTYSTRYEADGAVMAMYDANTTYSAMTTAEIDAGTGTTGRTITPANLKYAINTYAPIIDDLTSTSATSALSANQGKILKDEIDDLKALGKFLSLWDCSTGLPISFPQQTPYTYSTGDYFLVETVSTATPPVNYKPNGSSYTGTASSTTESEEVEVGDLYIYDGTTWLLQLNHGKTVSFSNLVGSPEDNLALDTALDAKQDVLTQGTGITITGTTISANSQVSDTAYAASWDGETTTAPSKNAVYDKLNTMDSTISGKQATLVSGTNIKTINSNSLLGSGDLTIPTYSAATSSVAGLVKLGSDTVQSVNAETVSGDVGRTYAIQNDGDGNMVVNVPRKDVPNVGASAPATPTQGMLWYDTTEDSLKVYDGSNWNGVGGGGGGVEPMYITDYNNLPDTKLTDGVRRPIRV